MSIRWVLLVVALSLSALSAAACSRSETVAGAPAVRCVYGLLESDPDVESIEVFRIDAYRSAIEYTLHDKKGRVTTDVEFLAPGKRTTVSGGDLLRDRLIYSRCRLSPVLDDMQPAAPPRSAWQRVDWRRQT